MSEFKKRFFGKWVLAGEYSVMRNVPALVYPLSHYYMDFEYKESNDPLKIKRKGKYQVGLEFSVAPLFEKALNLAGKNKEDLKGSLTINGFIPFGTGLGASSVICTGTASLFLFKGWIAKKQLKQFATSLENFFHGKSSGMDINVVLENQPILYQQGQPSQPLPRCHSKPLLFLSYSGGRSSTSVGVSKVRKFFDNNWSEAEQIDKNMEKSVNLCLQALKETDNSQCNSILTKALTLGEDCFHRWKLISYDLERQMAYLKQQGALAVKPTGSGLGGHVISLWGQQPPSSIEGLIPLEL